MYSPQDLHSNCQNYGQTSYRLMHPRRYRLAFNRGYLSQLLPNDISGTKYFRILAFLVTNNPTNSRGQKEARDINISSKSVPDTSCTNMHLSKMFLNQRPANLPYLKSICLMFQRYRRRARSSFRNLFLIQSMNRLFLSDSFTERLICI